VKEKPMRRTAGERMQAFVESLEIKRIQKGDVGK
jgi:hypothetical protein